MWTSAAKRAAHTSLLRLLQGHLLIWPLLCLPSIYLFYFPIITLAADAYAHFLPLLIDVPSVDAWCAFCFATICVGEDVFEKVSLYVNLIAVFPLSVLVRLYTYVTVRLLSPSRLTQGFAVVSLSSQQCPQGAKHALLCPGISIMFAAFLFVFKLPPPHLPSLPVPLLCCHTETRDSITMLYQTTPPCLCQTCAHCVFFLLISLQRLIFTDIHTWSSVKAN